MVGIGLKIASVTIFLLMASLLKTTADVPAGQMVFYRSAFAAVPIIVLLAFRGELREGIKTSRPIDHFWRSVSGICGMACSFYALTRLPLSEAVTIGYAMPLLIVVFSAIFLKENVRLYRWSAVLIGLVGVGVIMWPRLEIFSGGGAMSELAIGAVAALLGCCFGAFSTVLVRNLVFTERSATIVLYFSGIGALLALLSAPFGWIWLTPWQITTLAVAGIAGGIAQILLTESYRHAEVSVVAPFEYTSLLLSILIGYFAFHDVPTVEMLIGSTIVVAAGLFIIYREHQLGLERRRARAVSPSPPA